MVDLKKFVAYFLVLASIASSAAFALSGVLGVRAPNADSQTASVAEKTPPPVSENAFVEKVPDTSPKVDIEPGLPPIIVTDNLTENVAQGLTREFFRANLDGPKSVDGKLTVSLPSNSQIDSTVVKKLASPEPAALVTLPNFNEIPPSNKFKTSSDNSPESLYQYFVSLDKAFRDTILSKDFAGLMADDPSFDAISAAQLAHSRALYGLGAMTVPSSLSALHASAYKLVADAKKIVDVPTQDGNDPLKTLAVMKGISGKIELVIKNDFENFSAEFKKLEAQRITVFPKSKTTGFGAVAGFLVPEAHAQGVNISTLFDFNTISNFIANYGKWIRGIWEWLQKAVLQQLIHALILTVQQQVVGWINGNGSPQFVTDWRNFIGITYDAASNSTINRIADLLCGGTAFSLNIRAGFLPMPVYGVDGSRFQCTIGQIIDNLKNPNLSFSVNFSAGGGFESFGQLLQQNFFIASMETSDAALNDAIAATGAKKNEALAGAGFLSTKKCPPGSTIDTVLGDCYDAGGNYKGQPVLTTPGRTISDSLSHTLGLGPDSIVNANDIAGLIDAIINASVNRLIVAGADGLLGTYSGGGSISGAPNATSLCGNLVQGSQQYQNCIASGGSANTTAYQDPAAGSTADNPLGAGDNPLGITLPTQIGGQSAEVNLFGAKAYENFKRTDNQNGPAEYAIDGSPSTYSNTTGGGSPSYWYVKLPAADSGGENIDAIYFNFEPYGGYTTLNSWGGQGPYVILTDNAAWNAANPPDATWKKQLFASGQSVYTVPLDPAYRNLKTRYIGFEAADGIVLSDVVVYRHVLPKVDFSGIPTSLTVAAAKNFDPIIGPDANAPWVTAVYYPFYSTPTPPLTTGITYKITQSGNPVPTCTSVPPCTLPNTNGTAGTTYSFSYTATDSAGFTSKPVSKTVTVK